MDESPLAFVERWTQELRSLQTRAPGPASTIAATSEQLQRLGKELTARASDIPLSELARCEKELKALQDSISSTAAAAAPKSKFSFKRSAPAAPKPAPSSQPTPAALPRPAFAPASPLPTAANSASQLNLPPNSLTLSSRENVYLSTRELPSAPPSPSSSAAPALALASLSRCVVDLLPSSSQAAPPACSAVYLSYLADCVVLLPPSCGSALVQNCQRCVIVLGCHQFRMHESSECNVFLQAGSTPIIERCKGLVFSGYPTVFSLSTSSTPPAQVQDFDDPFATPERPSTNWRFATAEEAAVWEAQPGWSSPERRKEQWRDLLDAGTRP
ncbi:hypothetical protein JCM10207_009068 [Rhodosporidiobolus poonsookiae]